LKFYKYTMRSQEFIQRTVTAEGVVGAALGGLAGAALTKNVSGAAAGAELGSNLQDKLTSEEYLPEIERLRTGDYEGGKKYLYAPVAKKLLPLPGGSGLLYHVGGSTYSPMVTIWDPEGAGEATPPPRYTWEMNSEYQARLKKWQAQQARGVRQPQLIGKLTLENVDGFPMKGAVQVGTITVDEDYRGRGLAKALYGIVLTIMKRPLLAGSSQTPGGRRNWLSLSQIPGVEVQGWLRISDDELDFLEVPDAGKNIDTLMGKLGAQYLGKGAWRGDQFFSFDVQPGRTGKELEAVVKTHLSQVYNENYRVNTGLYAVWTGAA
jgi:GNAT superfamily N-acetyltransferase